jgi:hypothetical protein
MGDKRYTATRYILTAIAALLPTGFLFLNASGESASGWRLPLHVEVDCGARMFVDGARVDTLAVYRGQIVYWKKRDKAGPDLTVLFGRKLFHPRNPTRVVLTEAGRPRYVRVDDRARMRVYSGTPEKGFVVTEAGLRPLHIRVVPPPGD